MPARQTVTLAGGPWIGDEPAVVTTRGAPSPRPLGAHVPMGADHEIPQRFEPNAAEPHEDTGICHIVVLQLVNGGILGK